MEVGGGSMEVRGGSMETSMEVSMRVRGTGDLHEPSQTSLELPMEVLGCP